MLEYVVRTTALRRRRELLQLDESATVRLDIDGCQTVVAFRPGSFEVAAESDVDATLRLSQEAFAGFLAGAVSFDDAVTSGSATVDGEPGAARLVAEVLAGEAALSA